MVVNPESLDFPRRPGAYLFKPSDERVLYVGKATDLRSRIRSYFSTNPDRVMIPELVAKSHKIDFIITNNPSEALVLERQLIRQHKPKYNSMLKDDKSYPFLALTNHQVPLIMYTRHPPNDATRWGPFPDAGAAKRVVQLIRRYFGIRDCKELLPQGCLSMHIGLCSGPCIDPTGYNAQVKAVIRVMNGDGKELLSTLVSDMELQSEKMEFEQAGKTRDLIGAVQTTLRQQVISSRFYRDIDAIGFSAKGEIAVISVLHAEDGVVKAQENWPMVHRGDIGETVARFVSEHYCERRPPKTILVPTPIGEWLESWLSDERDGAVEVRVPLRGDLATLRKLADQNAEIQVGRQMRKHSGSLEQRAADEGAAILGMASLDHIVCFDMAQIQGEERVGACVVMRKGRPAKKEYRTFIVKSEAMDDLRMMREVVERWLKRQDEWPDLLLIDGGKTHLSVIRKLVEEHGISDRFEIAALAKREETIFRTGKEPIILDRMGRVMVHARDEAHRFVNTFHRKRRGKKDIGDPLESIEGLGAKKLQSLIRNFGGRAGINHASLEQLQNTPGIGPSLAKRILEKLSQG
jgi:excinuclease ABC subunit C